MAWTTIPPTATDPDAPLTSFIAKAWTDNPAAIANGDAGAPRVQDAAMSTTVTAAGRNWVSARYASTAWNAVGAIVMARIASNSSNNPGDVVSGSILYPASAGGSASSSSLPGTWECLGYIPVTPSNESLRVTNWRRVT